MDGVDERLLQAEVYLWLRGEWLTDKVNEKSKQKLWQKGEGRREESHRMGVLGRDATKRRTLCL